MQRGQVSRPLCISAVDFVGISYPIFPLTKKGEYNPIICIFIQIYVFYVRVPPTFIFP